MPIDTLQHLPTEQRNPASTHIDVLSTPQILALINDEDAKIAHAVRKCLPAIAQSVDAITDRFQQGGRLIYVGAGTSGRLAIVDASEMPPTFATWEGQVVGVMAGDAVAKAKEGAEDVASDGVGRMKQLNVTSKDAVVGIAASGRTPYVIGAVEYANSVGAVTIAVACNPDPTPLGEAAKISIAAVTGPEVVTGSTRLKAGTATKLILNMLTTASMIKFGKTYGNLMVDMRAVNEKLVIRAKRILRQACNVEFSDERASELLDSTGRDVKAAIVVASTGLPADEAKALLSSCNGFLSAALAKYTPSHRHRAIAVVDGGGTKTCASIAVNGDIFTATVNAASNFASGHVQTVLPAIEEAIHEAIQKSSLQVTITQLTIGLAGYIPSRDKSAQKELRDALLVLHPEANVAIDSDVALLARLCRGSTCTVLIVGTGSAAFAFDAQGNQTGREGGLGYLLGDEGSGYHIGKQAVLCVLHGQASPTVEKTVMEVLGADIGEIITKVYSADGKLLLCKIGGAITGIAGQDMMANTLVLEASTHVADLVRKLPAEKYIFSGGLFHSTYFSNAVLQAAQIPLERIRIVSSGASAVLEDLLASS